MITNLIKADLLIILTNTSGLWDGVPEKEGSEFISRVEEVTPEILEMARTDGMRMKLRAAKIVQEEGHECIIASGHEEDILLRLVKKNEQIGTKFVSRREKDSEVGPW
jgi:glutamate 5-kinase